MASASTRVPAPDQQGQSFLAHGMWIVLAIAAAKLIFHCYYNNRYGYFRDEFDYMACGDHLAWGYVDQPPLIPFLIHVCRAVLGDSLRSVRFDSGAGVFPSWWCRPRYWPVNLADAASPSCSAR